MLKQEINPVVAVVILLVVVIAVGAWLWIRAAPPTFTKETVRGIQFDISKAKGAPQPTGK